MRAAGDGIQQRGRCILRMACHKADAVIARHGIQQAQQARKINVFFEPLAVRVHILPQQRNIAVAGLYKLVEFPQNVCACAAALPAAHIGNDAVRTKIIASVHNGKPRAERGIPADGQILNNLGALGRRAQHASGCLQLFAQKRRQLINGVSAEIFPQYPSAAPCSPKPRSTALDLPLSGPSKRPHCQTRAARHARAPRRC